MIAPVPVEGVQTIYALVGDLFAQLCIVALLILVAFTLVRSYRQRTGRNAVAIGLLLCQNLTSLP
jgi:hypothetical protein